MTPAYRHMFADTYLFTHLSVVYPKFLANIRHEEINFAVQLMTP